MELKMKQPAEETLYLLQEYYQQNVEPLLSVLSDDCCWISPSEKIANGAAAIRAEFADGILFPVCHLDKAHFYQLESGNPDQITVYGDYRVHTDLNSQMVLAERQRITFCYRREADGWRLYHMHVSNLWSQLAEGEVFPAEVSRQTYEYLQECIVEQKKQIERQTAMLERLSFEDTLTGLFNRNKFNQMVEYYQNNPPKQLGVACFDLNGLKPVNDQLGHAAGDTIICRMAWQLKAAFDGKAYRIGGDEFVIIDDKTAENQFRNGIAALRQRFAQEQISVSIGLSWRDSACSITKQFDEADRLMYYEKAQFYQNHDRRSEQ